MDSTLTRSNRPLDAPEVVASTCCDATTPAAAASPEAGDAAPRQGRWRTTWAGVRAGLGALLGLVPHLMHHIGILAGTAFLTGVFGNSVLYVAGLVLSIPLLHRLRKRFGGWKAPVVGVIVFTAMFLVSALVLGPAINRLGAEPAPQAPIQQVLAEEDHEAHHGD